MQKPRKKTRRIWVSLTNLRVHLAEFEKYGCPEAGKSSLEPPENIGLCPLHCDFLSESCSLGKKSLMKYLETLLSISMLIQHVNLIKSFAIWKKWFHFCTQKPSFKTSILILGGLFHLKGYLKNLSPLDPVLNLLPLDPGYKSLLLPYFLLLLPTCIQQDAWYTISPQ